ncbi:response regulator [bacterium]|nr:response regulator [bacterium]
MAKEKKILIVEDERPMAKALELKLNKSGFLAKAVGNGQEAVNLLKKEKFDLVITDLVMPKMDGFGLLEYIKKNKIKIKVIVASNLSQDDDVVRAKKLGASDFLVKSNIPITKVVERVKNILEK